MKHTDEGHRNNAMEHGEYPEQANAGAGPSDNIYSQDKYLNSLLQSVVNEVKLYAEIQISKIRELVQIGTALSGEKDIGRLLDTIVDGARRLTHADAGTLYIVDRSNKVLRFGIMQNDTMDCRMNGTNGVEINLPPIPLEIEGSPNYTNVSSHVALTGETANITDVYRTDLFDFTGPKEYDTRTGYHSTSMLVIPMKNHENEIIGVLQLLNATSPETGKVISFTAEDVVLTTSLASQAAIALTNTHLVLELKNLLYAFIKSIALAIDAKSPYTGGHVNRVVELTVMIADRINNCREGRFERVSFSEDDIEQMRMAAWMHDVGKITTPEYVLNKQTKLETIFDRIKLIELRFDLIKQTKITEYLEKKTEMLEEGGSDSETLQKLKDYLEQTLKTLDREKEFLVQCNDPGTRLDDMALERLRDIGRRTYKLNGSEFPYLTPEEVDSLSIPQGTLSEDERKVIEQHALMTYRILSELSFPKKLADVPKLAAFHHERPDGSGYPFGLKAAAIPIGASIMAVADVFEALTARDRPYKKPLTLSQAVKILGYMKQDRHIDPDICDLFISERIYKEYAEKELDPVQIDC